MFANLVAAPFIVCAFVFFYLAWQVDEKYAIGIIPFVLIAALVYIFSPQINWWRYRRRPPVMEPPLADLLERSHGFYQRLSAAGRQKFRDRVMLFRMGTDWMPMGWPEEKEILPTDLQFVLSVQAVTVTFGKPEFLFHKFEKVIVYPYPFPSPEYPFAHASELFEEDGCLLFSAEQVMLGFLQPAQWYNVGLHEYARAFVLTYPKAPYPAFTADDVWEKLEAASGMSRSVVESVIGLAGVEALPVAIHHFFTFPEKFRPIFPEASAAFDQIFETPDLKMPDARL